MSSLKTNARGGGERTIDIRYFDALVSRLGLESETLTLPQEIETIGDLVPWLMTRRGEWQKALSGNLKITVNRMPADKPTVIRGNDEVAFMLATVKDK